MKHRDSLVENVVESIRHHTVRKVVTSPPDAKVEQSAPAVEVLMRRARHILKVSSSVSARADGFSSTTPGNGNPGGG